MPITINGSGTVTGITPGGLPDGSITTDDLAANAVTTPKLGTDEASGLAKAWVNFNGTGTVAIRAQYNVSSITDNGTGDYTVNFATALVDANYSIAGASSGSTAGVAGNFSVGVRQDGVTASACRLSVFSTNNTATDTLIVATSIFR
jgi:hypothetical protein